MHLLCLLLRPSFFFSFETGILVRSVRGRDLHCVTVGSELVALPLYSPPLALFGAVDAMGKKGNKTSAATKASAANGADSSSLALHGETLKMIQVCDSTPLGVAASLRAANRPNPVGWLAVEREFVRCWCG